MNPDIVPYHGIRPHEMVPEIGPIDWWQRPIIWALWLLAAVVALIVFTTLTIWFKIKTLFK